MWQAIIVVYVVVTNYCKIFLQFIIVWFNGTSIKTHSILKTVVLVIFTPQMNFEKLLSQSYVFDHANTEIFKYIIHFHSLIQPGYALEKYALLYMRVYHTSFSSAGKPDVLH